MAAMATTRGTAEIASAADMFTLSDHTTWSYDQPTGRLANKLRADGKGTAQTIPPASHPPIIRPNNARAAARRSAKPLPVSSHRY